MLSLKRLFQLSVVVDFDLEDLLISFIPLFQKLLFVLSDVILDLVCQTDERLNLLAPFRELLYNLGRPFPVSIAMVLSGLMMN